MPEVTKWEWVLYVAGELSVVIQHISQMCENGWKFWCDFLRCEHTLISSI